MIRIDAESSVCLRSVRPGDDAQRLSLLGQAGVAGARSDSLKGYLTEQLAAQLFRLTGMTQKRYRSGTGVFPERYRSVPNQTSLLACCCQELVFASEEEAWLSFSAAAT